MDKFKKEEEQLLYKVLSIVKDVYSHHFHCFPSLITQYIHNHLDNLNEDSSMSVNDLLTLLNKYGFIIIDTELNEVDMHHLHFIDLKEFFYWLLCDSRQEASLEIPSFISLIIMTYEIELNKALRSR